MSPKTNRGGLPKPDTLGRWRPEVGYGYHGKRIRFQVGNKRHTTEADALKRLNAIRDLYDRQCEELKISYWADWVYGWAIKLAQGVPVSVVMSLRAAKESGQAAEELDRVRTIQSWGVPVNFADNLPAIGYSHIRKKIEEEVGRSVAAALTTIKGKWGSDLVEETEQQTASPADPAAAPRGTLHESIEDYKSHLTQTGKRDGQGNLSPHIRKCLEWLDMLRQSHADRPLWELDYSKIEAIVSHWRNRPPTKRSERCSIEFASKMLQEFNRYLHWLDRQPKYRWSLPHGVEQLKRSPNKLREDDHVHQTAFHSTTKHTYTAEQLAVIIQFTNDFGRTLIGVCVNCAFGASEVGQLDTKNYNLYAEHPYAAKLGITSTNRDSWIVGKRPKTGIYGEHLLWDEVAISVKPFLDGRPVLPVTGEGRPWYRTHSKNAQAQFGNWWSDLLDRVVKKHPAFPRLAFGSLRDLLPNILRREYSDEVASLALQHGKLSSDDLLNCYANLPFSKLFVATRELRTMFNPFLSTLATPKVKSR